MAIETRRSLVPWLWDSDFDQGGDQCWDVDVRPNEEKVSCWRIATFTDGDQYVIVRAARGNGNDGGEIALALSPTPRYDVFARNSFALNHIAQRNPNRAQGDGDDGA